MRKFVTSSIDPCRGRPIAGFRSSVRPPMPSAVAAVPEARRPATGPPAHRAAGSSTPQVRSQSSSSVNNDRGTQTANRGNTNVNRNTNVNVDRDVNVDIDNDWDNNYNDYDRHPVARGAAIATTAAIVAGSVYRTLAAGLRAEPLWRRHLL